VITTLTELFRALACVSLELPEQGKCELFLMDYYLYRVDSIVVYIYLYMCFFPTFLLQQNCSYGQAVQ
jgi:hypothetical protein